MVVTGPFHFPDYTAGKQPWAAALYEIDSDDIYVSNRYDTSDFDSEPCQITAIGANAFVGAKVDDVYLGSTITSITEITAMISTSMAAG